MFETNEPDSVEVVVIDADDKEERQYKVFCRVLTLSVAYAANVGGIGTLTGTPPNLVLKNQVDA